MLFKLSIKNIKKSMKDYSIYFITLIFAVAMFYMFNSLDAQNSMLILNDAKQNIAKALVSILGYVSIFVSVILGFLIIYSNCFLIKRRKKEIGLYLTLGMGKRKVSFILVIETLLIGLISLVIGLAIGVFLSQFLSMFTAKLFQVDMTAYKFVFSQNALIKTIMYFGIMFVLVMIFNVWTLSKSKLIDLINANRKNEKVKFRNTAIVVITFILAIATIGYAYYLLYHNALLELNSTTLMMFALGAIGTLLLFFSLSGFLIRVFKRIKGLYYKDLNMFVFKQVNNKINTNVISNTVISLMLLFTIGILSASMSLASVYNNNMKENNLADFTIIYTNTDRNIRNGNITFKKNDDIDASEITNREEFKKYVKESMSFVTYTSNELTYGELVDDASKIEMEKQFGTGVSFYTPASIIKESDYINLMKLYGKDKEIIDVKDGGYLLLANVQLTVDGFKSSYEGRKPIVLNGTKLMPASEHIITTATENYNSNGNAGIIVVCDNLTEGLDKYLTTIEGNFKEEYDLDEIDTAFDKYASSQKNLRIRTKNTMEASSIGLSAIVTFIGLYLGIIFALCSATTLAIQQLSESSDNKDRYKILKELGADKRGISKALFSQIAIAFVFPLSIAIIHSIVGLKEINRIIKAFVSFDVSKNIFITSLFIIVLYGGYFLLTYKVSKRIIEKN